MSSLVCCILKASDKRHVGEFLFYMIMNFLDLLFFSIHCCIQIQGENVLVFIQTLKGFEITCSLLRAVGIRYCYRNRNLNSLLQSHGKRSTEPNIANFFL